MRINDNRTARKANVVLWIAQGALSLLFLFTGSMKLILPIAAFTQQMPAPGLFIRCLGVFEILCALGLIFPGILHWRTELTILACVGIVVVMIGAVGATLATHGGATALGPVPIGLLAAFVAYGRLWLLPEDAAIRQIALRRAA